ncbi:MAG TPA: AAA family ATPase [Leptospiraceae bacterium]|nr:AAA family ATPase [Leptospiraceae bacterium]HMW06353.1 AAA family ATPase [Leptospiraceae bacterium]HMX30968.1 AAA family ATPase [Leptospiraceae bacterium]HMY34306.1 AAA family ATPase [Leptospiraceae bacterium]HMZ63786.1 AAA family ATPase [Leptospiraceae bacterium]
MKRLPLGIQTFSEMIEDNHYYVDKTMFVHKLASVGKYFFLSRPRRFGKSSFLDTLKEAYEGNEKLFQGLFLEKNWNWQKKHPVIKISFGGGIMQSSKDVLEKIEGILQMNEKHLGISCQNKTISNCFTELIQSSFEKYKQKVVILIDEYDKPILDNIEKPDVPYEVREILKGFYSVIKDSDNYIQFVFITGVSKFSRINLFSGLNNLTDITLDPDFASICGYTQKELNQTFADLLTDVPMDQLKEWYNGYNFCGDKVYNPYDVLNYFRTKDFKNYWFETGTPSFLIKLIDKRKFPIPDLENIQLTESSLNSFDIGSIELETLLFQTGYLTIESIQKVGDMTLYEMVYPNKEVRMSLNDVILKYLSTLNTEKELNKVKLYRLLEAGDINGMRDLFHAFFASIPYNWYTNNEIASYEGYYSSIFYTYFTAIGVEVKVEDASNKGRIDMVAILNGRCYILEFKVNEMTPNGKAIAQLKERKYHEKYIGYVSTHLGSGTVSEIYLIGVEFNKTDRNITAFDWEKI